MRVLFASACLFHAAAALVVRRGGPRAPGNGAKRPAAPVDASEDRAEQRALKRLAVEAKELEIQDLDAQIGLLQTRKNVLYKERSEVQSIYDDVRFEVANAEYNGLVLAVVFGSALVALLYTDVVAIEAMQHYGIEGWKAEGVALLGRLPKDFLGSYGGAARAAPLLTMAATSSVSYFLGDLAAQVVEGRRSARLLDLPRCARNAALGFFLHGPMLHFWIVLVMEGPQFAALEQSNGELAARGAKILLDQTVFSAVINVVYAVIDGVLSDKSLTDSLARARQTLAPALVSSWRFWPAVHLLSYSPLIPVDFKILWIDCMEVIWVAILSTTVNTAPETPKQSVPWNEGLYFDGTPPEAADEQ